MILKNAFAAMVCAALLTWSGRSAADEYRPEQFLGLDLSSAVLSPKRLGPPAEFTPIPIEARGDRPRERVVGSENARAVAVSKIRVAHRPNAKPHAITQTRVAHHHGNPLDAQAQDTRIQAWPCRSGGICGWKR
jgi:hypothetical protein